MKIDITYSVSHFDPNAYGKPSASALPKTAGKHLIESIKFNASWQVLDIGCGDGELTALLAKQLPKGHVTAIDNQQGMIQAASTQYPASNITHEIIDARDMPYVNRFDMIFSNFTLQWVDNKALAFQQIAKALKPEGLLYIRLNERNELLCNIRDEAMKLPRWSARFEGFVDTTLCIADTLYASYAVAAGLTVTYEDKVAVTSTYDNAQLLANFVMATSPHVKVFSTESDKNVFVNIVVNTFLSPDCQHGNPPIKELVKQFSEAPTPLPTDSCSITYNYITLSAQKPPPPANKLQELRS